MERILLADLERQLSDEDKYEDFKRAFAEIRGKEWILAINLGLFKITFVGH